MNHRKDRLRFRNANCIKAMLLALCVGTPQGAKGASAANIDWGWNAAGLPQHDKAIQKAAEAYGGGDTDSALAIINQCKGQSQDDCRVRSILVDIYSDLRRFQEARAEMTEIISIEQRMIRSVSAIARPKWADVPMAKNKLGTICENEGDYASAIRFYQEAQAIANVEKQKDWAMPYLGIARCHEAQKEWDQAKQAYESAMKDPYMDIGTKQNLQSKITQLEQRINAGIAETPSPNQGGPSGPAGIPPRGNTGGSISTGSPSFGSSPVSFSNTSFGSSSIPTPAQRAAAPVNRPVAVQQALQEIDLKHYDAASTILSNYLARNKTNGEAHYLLAVTYAFQKKYAEAAKEYESAIEFANNLQLQRKASDGLRKVQPKQQ